MKIYLEELSLIVGNVQILKELEDPRKGKEHKIYRCAGVKTVFFTKHIYSGICKMFNDLTHLKILRFLYMNALERKLSQGL